jgi:YD repeat-containing protein
MRGASIRTGEVTVTRGNGSVTSYGYDTGSRLTSLALALPAAGASGNLTLSLGYSGADQLTARTVSNGGYGWPVAALAGGYDANGNLGNDGVRALTYDYDDRLVQVTQASGATAMTYYPGGELQQVAVTVTGATTATQFLYEGDQLAGEYNSGVLLRRYVHGADADEPLVWYDSADGFQRRWLHADERGSIIGWSDGSGVMRATFSYGPYGEPSSWAGTRFAYTDSWRDFS